jgi:hypothetical protein
VNDLASALNRRWKFKGEIMLRKNEPKSIEKMEAYTRIMHKSRENKTDIRDISHRGKLNLVYAFIRFLGMVDADNDPEIFMSMFSFTTEVCKYLTPRDIEAILPIAKEYDGKRYGTKDYFSTKKVIKELGEDTPLGDNVNHFLFEYHNWHVMEFVVESMSAMSAIRRKQGKKEMFTMFIEICRFKEGIDTEIVEDKLKDGINGLEWLVLQTIVDEELKQKLNDAYIEFDGIDGFIARVKKALQKPKRSVTDWTVLHDLLTHLSLLRERKYDDYFELLNWIYA